MSSQEAIDRKMYLSVQCVRMKEELLRTLAEGPDEEWHEPAVKELARRASPGEKSVFHGGSLSPNF